MKKLLIITEVFFPYSGANVNCINKIIAQLQRMDYSVSILTVSYEKELPKHEIIKGCSVYRITMPEIDTIDRILYRDKVIKNEYLRILRGVIGKMAFSYANLLKKMRMKKIFKQLKSEKIERVMSVVNPIGAHDIAFDFADENTKWVMYNLDAYTFNYSYNGSPEQRMKDEKRWSSKASGVINIVGITEENERHSYFPYEDLKQLEVPLPNLTINDDIIYPEKTGSKIVMRYTGMFYSNIRRPDELIKLLDKLDPDVFQVEFYGSCCEYVKMHFDKLPSCLKLMGSVGVEKCVELTETADILINVGNLCPNQIPSKVFEYISTGKPILNICLSDKDPSLVYLNNYPNIINVGKADDVKQEDLINLSNKEVVSAEKIKDIYNDCLEENVVRKIVDFIESL